MIKRRIGFSLSMILFYGLSLNGAEKRRDILMIDNFNRKSMTNLLGGKLGAWNADPDDKTAGCEISFDAKTFVGPEGYSLKIDYDAASNKTTYLSPSPSVRVSPQELGYHGIVYNGIYMLLKDCDGSPYNYLVFSLKGDAQKGYTRRIKMELKDDQRAKSVAIEDITSHWKKFIIPLRQFKDVISLKRLKEFVIVFDQYVTLPEGALYLDDIYFAVGKKADLYKENK